MPDVLRNSWPLLLGMLMLLLGNGLQGTLLGIRGGIEGFGAETMAFVMSAYFLGFLAGSIQTPRLIGRVGHVRVFAALASIISAAFVLYAVAPNPWVWLAMRLLVGFAFSGVYVVAESWLNDTATNENRGQTLSLYMVVQMLGIIAAQGLINFGDPSGFVLFAVMSVMVSLSFIPILLSAGNVPAFQLTTRMTLFQLFRISPLGVVGSFLLGAVFSGLFGMSSVFGTEKQLTVSQISLFIATIYIGGLLLQFPIGWLSDRMDRRKLIMRLTAFAAIVVALGLTRAESFPVVLALGFVIGAVANPVYSLLIAHTNDFLKTSDMAAASGGLLFINGLGAVSGPILIGWLMARFGPDAYFGYMGVLFGMIALYAVYRMTRRPAPAVLEATPYAPINPQATPVAMEAAQEYVMDLAEAEENREVATGSVARAGEI